MCEAAEPGTQTAFATWHLSSHLLHFPHHKKPFYFFRAAVEFATSLNAEHPCPEAESFGIGAGLGFRTLILFLVAPVAFFFFFGG